MDEAWAAVEACLPEGWRIHLIEVTVQDDWRAIAGKRHDDGQDPFIAFGDGPTPTAALLALAERLAALA